MACRELQLCDNSIPFTTAVAQTAGFDLIRTEDASTVPSLLGFLHCIKHKDGS